MDNITIGYLSWKRHNIFKQTLSSHRNNGLFDIIPSKNRLIFFQELSDDDIMIADQYECNYIGHKDNIGILNGFIELIQKCTTEYFIFCENDWYLVENKSINTKILEDSIMLLNNCKADIIKLRHRKLYGEPLYSKPTNIEEWLKQDYNGCPYKLESLSWLDEPNKVYNNIMEEFNGNYKWYITTLEHQRWSNNIFIGKTDYIKNTILPLITFFSIENNKYSGLEDILINYNNYLGKDIIIDNCIKQYSNMKLASGEGLFMHRDNIIL